MTGVAPKLGPRGGQEKCSSEMHVCQALGVRRQGKAILTPDAWRLTPDNRHAE
jgi:hypothetical protein